MKPMFEAAVVPALRAPSGRVVVTRALHTFGLGESDLAARLGELMERGRNPLVGTTVRAGVVTCRVRYEGPAATDPTGETERAIRERLGAYVFGEGDETLASVVLSLLRSRGLTLATVESCTGGLLGGALTAIAGSSDVYLGGWVTYANEMKVGEVGVPPEILGIARAGERPVAQAPGAVSREAAEAMARGGLERSGAGVCVSVTGIAGPGGGSAEKPVGTVWIGVATGGAVAARRFLFPGSREQVRVLSVNSALATIRLVLLGEGTIELLREVR
jgi:nicotinamide-nucleotide amidase